MSGGSCLWRVEVVFDVGVGVFDAVVVENNWSSWACCLWPLFLLKLCMALGPRYLAVPGLCSNCQAAMLCDGSPSSSLLFSLVL